MPSQAGPTTPIGGAPLAHTLGDVRSRLVVALAPLLAALVVWPAAGALAQVDEDGGGRQEEGEGTDAEAQADEGEPGYEPDQRGYEPDQRGYEPDQRGNEGDEGGEGESTGGDGGYEPDQRGYDDDEEEREELMGEPTVAMEAADAGYGGAGDYGAGFGLDLRLWLGASGSFLDVFEEDNLLRDSQRGGAGGGFGVTLGFRFGPVTVGPRHTLVVDQATTLATFGLDVLVRLLPEQLTPHVRVAISYALAFGFSDSLPSQGTAQGLLTELGVGFGGRVVGPMTLGAELSAGWLALYRGDVAGCEDPCTSPDLDLTRSGQAHGLILRGTVWIGVEL